VDEQRSAEEKRIAAQAAAETTARLERENQEQEAKTAALKKKILANPTHFLWVSDTEMFNKGIVNSYRQLTRMTVTNKTKYPLEDLGGQVEWLDDQGVVRELTTFRLKESIAAGDTKIFRTGNNMDSSTTDSHAHKLRVKFVTAKFVESPEVN
jgi:hypothetical protein